MPLLEISLLSCLSVIMFSSNVLFEEFVLRSLSASPFTTSFFPRGG